VSQPATGDVPARRSSELREALRGLLLGAAVGATFWYLLYGDVAEGRLRWNYSHWLFSYEFGFLRRGLVGSLVAALAEPPGLESVRAYYAGLLWATFTAYWGVLALRRRWITTGGAALLLAGIVSPFFLRNFVLDHGRFDVLGLLAAMAVLAGLSVGIRLAAGIALVASALLPAAHEAQVLLYLPVIWAFVVLALLRARRRREALAFLLTAVLIAGAVLLALTLSNPALERSALWAVISERSGGNAVDNLFVLYEGLAEKRRYVWRWPHWSGHATLVREWSFTAVVTLGLAALGVRLLSRGESVSRPIAIAAAAAILFANLAAWGFGSDWARFSANGVTAQLLLVHFAMLYCREPEADGPLSSPAAIAVLLGVALAFLYVPAAGVGTPFLGK
jgi:hypothetical protein